MSSPSPESGSTAARPRNASKYLFLLLLGLVIGIVATVMALRAIDARRDKFPNAVMQVQQWHLGQLKASIDQNRCGATDSLPHLQALRTVANDIEPAFPDLSDDKRFADAASQMRSDLDAALSSPPLNCAGVASAMKTIGESCKACHQDFRG